MRAEGAQSESKPVRFHYIWVPERDPAWEDWFILGAGILVSWGAVYFALSGVIERFFSERPGGVPWGGWITVIMLAWSGPAVWILFVMWLDRRRRRRPRRAVRLSRVVAHDEAARRLPHRCVEWALRNGQLRSKRFVSCLMQLPVGRVVLANWGSRRWLAQPECGEVSFEPISLFGEWDRLEWLRRGGRAEQPPSCTRIIARRPCLPAPRSFWQRTWFLVNRFGLPLILIVLMVWRVYFHGMPVSPAGFYWPALLGLAVPFFLVLALVVVVWLVSLFHERNWWLVPGGLVCRGFSFWRRGVSVSLFTRENTPLLLDARTGTGFVLDGGRLRRFACLDDDVQAVINAWISRARTPSLDEVRAFVGQQDVAKPPS